MKKLNAGNLLAGARSSTLIAGLFIVLIVSIVLLFANFAYINTQSNYDTEYIGHSGELRVLSQRIAKNSTEAAAGTAEAFALLRDARNDFQTRWGYLTDGSEESGLPPAPESLQPQMTMSCASSCRMPRPVSPNSKTTCARHWWFETRTTNAM